MNVESESREVDSREMARESEADPLEEAAAPNDLPERYSPRRALPWIGSLANPHLVPMAVLNDSGYLLPLWTSSDLLRGCKYYWRAAQE